MKTIIDIIKEDNSEKEFYSKYEEDFVKFGLKMKDAYKQGLKLSDDKLDIEFNKLENEYENNIKKDKDTNQIASTAYFAWVFASYWYVKYRNRKYKHLLNWGLN